MATNASAVLDALGDPTRRLMVELLGREPMAVGELADRLPVSRPAVSQHLRVLRTAGLVTVRPEGTRRVYRLDRAGLDILRSWLDVMWRDGLRAFAAALQDDTATGPPGRAGDEHHDDLRFDDHDESEDR